MKPGQLSLRAEGNHKNEGVGSLRSRGHSPYTARVLANAGWGLMLRTLLSNFTPPLPRRALGRAALLPPGALLLAAMVLQAPVAGAQRKTITLDELVVEGNIQKPEAFFILPRTSLNFDGLDRRADLKSKILESVKAAPF